MFVLGPGVVHLVLLLIAFAFAIALHISSTTLSLPAAGTTPGTVLLTVFAGANTLFHPLLLHSARKSNASFVQRLFPTALQSLQAVLTTGLATLLLQHALPSDVRACTLATTWQHLFASKDAGAIRQIQDALDCCGLNSVHDRAWPFPESGGGPGACAKRFERHTPCVGPWGAQAVEQATLGLVIVLVVAGLQIAALLVASPAKQWRRSWWAQGWRTALADRRNLIEDRERVRPLLEAAPVVGEDVEEADEVVPYRDLSPTRITGPNYGTGGGNGGGPRVEPSGLDRNAWSTE